MVKVLVIGATGFVGGAVIHALRSNNHRVYGVARTPEKAKFLAQREVIVIPGSADDSKDFLKVIEEQGIDAVIDLIGNKEGSYKILEELTPIAQRRLKTRGSKLGFVYVSGIWVHGSSPDHISDLDVIGDKAPNPPAQAVAWRPDYEAKVLASRDLFDVIIIRPGIVYGTTSPIWGLAFGAIYQAVKNGRGGSELTIEIDPSVNFNLVHNDDTGTSIQLALEQLSAISGSGTYPVFNIVSSYENLGVIVTEGANALGFTGKLNFVKPSEDNVFSKGFNTAVNTSSDRAISLLGWKPTRHSILADIGIYANSWKAAQD